MGGKVRQCQVAGSGLRAELPRAGRGAATRRWPVSRGAALPHPPVSSPSVSCFFLSASPPSPCFCLGHRPWGRAAFQPLWSSPQPFVLRGGRGAPSARLAGLAAKQLTSSKSLFRAEVQVSIAGEEQGEVGLARGEGCGDNGPNSPPGGRPSPSALHPPFSQGRLVQPLLCAELCRPRSRTLSLGLAASGRADSMARALLGDAGAQGHGRCLGTPVPCLCSNAHRPQGPPSRGCPEWV